MVPSDTWKLGNVNFDLENVCTFLKIYFCISILNRNEKCVNIGIAVMLNFQH